MTMENVEKSVRRESRLAVFEHIVKRDKDSNNKNFVVNRLESDESSPSDSELIIDDERDQANKNKKLSVRLTEEPLCLKCEWNWCNGIFTSWQKFNVHLLDHVRSQSDNLSCLWKKCNITCASLLLLMQHISYHGYFSKLKNIGRNVLERNDLPACTQHEMYVIPVSLGGYTCEWELCSVIFTNVYDYFSHVEQHVGGNPRIAKGNEEIRCCWNGCYAKFSTRYKLGEHVRTHTKEKTIGCPTCSTIFSNKTKFCDHRRRQLSTDLQRYQCSQCLKLFPSERLLRDHMRSHINHYKCTMCDMTCSKPSILAKHIRFKHVMDKPFECTECDKKFVTKHNLETHLKTHNDDSMICDICDFKCRTKVGLQSHYVKKHDQFSAEYECHCCKKKFKRGGHLTKHLMKVHNFHWPSGHSRFRYRKDQDGIYRLQTVRYESLEVTEEMIKSETMQYKNDKEYPATYVVSMSDENFDQIVKDEPRNDVFITINDVDEKGNILRSQVMKTKEIIGTLTDDKLILTGHHLPDTPKEQTCNSVDELKADLLEFVDMSKVKDSPPMTQKNKVKRKNDKKSRRKPKNKIVITNHINTGSGQLQTNIGEFINLDRKQEDKDETVVQKHNSTRKRKRQRGVIEANAKFKKGDGSSVKIVRSRRRSKRLKTVKGSAKNNGDV